MMKQTPRERILSAGAHRQPDRVPFSWGFGPTPEMAEVLTGYLAERGYSWARLRAAVEDVNDIGLRFLGSTPARGTDLWGIRRQRVGYGDGAYEEIVFSPLAGLENPHALATYPWPDPELFAYGDVRKDMLTADPTRFRAKKFAGGNPFEIYCWMTGLEEAMVNLLANPELVVAALACITDYFEQRLRRMLEVNGDLVDLVFLADDLGSQQGLLMSRATYRAILMPFHRRLTDAAKELAPHAKILFHSDGSVFDLLPDLIEAGIDILEAVQTDAAKMVPEELKATFGDRLGFHGGISVQNLLPHGDEAQVSAECRRLVRVFGHGGGYIAAPAHAIQVGTPPENVLTMLRTVLGEDDYATALDAARSS